MSYNSPTCNNKPVAGAGRDAAAKVWYSTLTNELTSRSGYADAREGAIRQAKAIYGKGSAQCSSIAAAFDGIAVPAGTQTCGN
ncbi:M4 family metallopeptidase [Arsenicicoccus cauae]|uniref:M4 family metallopeptidase n=1 Tax=Arsenicicoccus cauae TaxID=2663847 RepID=UPI00289C0D5F|nr:M4 family metallopeptidase [Arsenicicoccus cauae]